MIRIILYFIAIGVLAAGVIWLADRPGDVIVTWQGLRIETSVMVLAAAVLATLIVLVLLWSIFRAILRSPMFLTRLQRHRRGVRAYEAISSGLVAVGSGDIEAAQKHSATAKRLAPTEPLALLLHAQSAQLAGDRAEAERAFTAMASRPDTKSLGLHGLYIEAHRRNDQVSARAYAEEAARTSPELGWANRAVLEARCKDGDWSGALALLEANARTLAREVYRRQRAVLLTARAYATQDTDRDMSKASALEAVKLDPTFVPAAALAGRHLAEEGHIRWAARIVEKAWRAHPHPDLAQVYTDLRFGDAARDKLKRIEGLAKKAAGHVEGALALARSALDAREFAKARAALAPYLAAPTKRVALLMAELERAERNDEGRAREWLARAVHAMPDPEWTADGHVSKQWQPVSPLTGRLDAFEWRVPLTGIAAPPAIEPEPTPAAAATATIGHEPLAAEPAAAAPSPATEDTPQTQSEPEPNVAPIIPLVHAPDDPGPNGVEESETAEQPNAWRGGFR